MLLHDEIKSRSYICNIHYMSCFFDSLRLMLNIFSGLKKIKVGRNHKKQPSEPVSDEENVYVNTSEINTGRDIY